MVQRSRPRPRSGLSPLSNLVVLMLIVASAGLVGLLIWSQIEVRESLKPMIGPGTFMDSTQTIVFDVPQGWEVFHRKTQTRIESVDGSLPAYDLEILDREQMNLVVNWNCLLLPDLIPGVMQFIGPPGSVITFSSVPCAQDSTAPVTVRVYLSLADGRSQVIVFGPLNGIRWVVTRTVPFEGQSSVDLLQAMVTTVTTSKRR
jgi:hypothetical protein